MVSNAAVKLLACMVALSISAHETRADNGNVRQLERAAEIMGPGLSAIQAENWNMARRAAVRSGEAAAETLVEWRRLRAGGARWKDYRLFLREHGDWPGLKILRRAGEAAIPLDAPPAAVEDYFAIQPPQTGSGAIALAAARLRAGDQPGAKRAIVDGWKSLPFNSEERERALDRFGRILQPMHWIRLDNLLWDGRRSEALEMMRYVGPKLRGLAEARLALMASDSGVDGRIAALDPEMADDPGLAFERVRWRWRNGHPGRAVELLLERSRSAETLKRPDKWARLRFAIAHELMRLGDFQNSYRVAASHHLGDSPDFPDSADISEAHRKSAVNAARLIRNDLEWHAGYVALRKMQNPEQALDHFLRFRDNILSASNSGTGHSPISLGRAGYWLGLAFEAAGRSADAQAAYAFGARHQISFYGQLSAERISAQTDRNLAGGMSPGGSYESFLSDEVVRAGLLQHHAGHSAESGWFLSHRAETLTGSQNAALCRLAENHSAYFAMVKTAKQALKQGDLLTDCLFPLTGIEDIGSEYAAAVARQETEFRSDKISPSGAVGLMQLLPSTAEEMAGKIGMGGRLSNLLANPETNLRLGTAYLDELRGEFGNSLPLSIASYNAGPGRVRSWFGQIGDPRLRNVDPVDWIESIPFNETRNYVMRVMESAVVYRVRMNGTDMPIQLTRDLVSGR